MNKILKQSVLVIAIALVTGVQARADDGSWYLATDFGYTRFNPNSDYSQPGMVAPVSSESGGGYRIGGGYRFGPNFALEATYLDAGHTDIGPDAVLPKFGNPARIMRSHGVTLDAIGGISIHDTISLYVRTGYMNATTERKIFNDGATMPAEPDLSMHGTQFGIGVGIAWQYEANWVVRTQWQRYYSLGNADIAVRGNLNIATLGIEYHY